MDDAITLSSLAQMLGLLAIIGGLWYRVETRISAGAVRAETKAELTHAQLNDFKLEVAENYAKNGYLKDVEQRLLQRFDAIVTELHGMRADFQKAMVDMAESRNSSTRKRP